MSCSSTTSAAREDVIAGLPSLGQPKVCLPRQGPSRVGVRWFLAGESGDPGRPSLQRSLTALRGGAARSSFTCLGSGFFYQP
jgi:hypothetical protein